MLAVQSAEKQQLHAVRPKVAEQEVGEHGEWTLNAAIEVSGKLYIDFERDLRDIILSGIATCGILSKAVLEMDINHLLAKWFEILERHVEPVPRTVYMSREMEMSLSKLGNSRKEREAKSMASKLCRRFELEKNVTPWLSKKIREYSSDQMLLQYGLHHFHLSRGIGKDGFSTRSDYLLFAHILKSDAYFVDVRLHKHPKGLRWVDQKLPEIMFRNWPELFTKISGVAPPTITDEEKKELWRKNVNAVLNIDGNAYVVGRRVGQTFDGTSTLLLYEASLFLHRLREIQSRLEEPKLCDQLSSKLEHHGVDVSQGIELELVGLDGLNLSEERKEALIQENCVNRTLALYGLTIVERSKLINITIHEKGQQETVI